jgi:two-component system sensor histidine kinase UhpB
VDETTAGTVPSTERNLGDSYAEALEATMADSGESALRRAYEIGRAGLARGVSLLDMATMHHEVLARIAGRVSHSVRVQHEIRRAGELFAEMLSPYEMAQRGFSEAVMALRSLNETMEREIQRIAHSVHDEAGQLLDAARLAVADVDRDATPGLRERLQQLRDILDDAEKELRRLSHELRPVVLDDLGLTPALQILAERVSKRSGMNVQVETCMDGRAPPKVETALYRIIQEALTNVVRHARATNVRIELGRDERGTLCCSIRDDGVGFDPAVVLARKEKTGLGLIGMRERLNAVGGTLQIRSEPGWGAEVRVEVPAEK